MDEKAAARKDNGPPHGEPPIHILLVDDQRITATLLQRMVRTKAGQGLQLHYVQDPLQAVAEIRAQQPNVVLLDMMMPGLDGLELLKQLRSQPETRQLPVVMLSMVEDPQRKAQAFALGANDYVIKLPDPVEMLARMRHHGNAHLAVMRQQATEAELRRHRDHLEEMVKERTAALTQRETHLQSILDNALDAIISIDQEGRTVGFNPAAQALFGYSREEALGQNIAALIIPPELRDKHQAGLARWDRISTEATPFKRRVELLGMRADGQRIDLQVAITHVKQEGKNYFTAFLQDITDRRQLLKSLEETLTTAELANRSKSEFIANMSHEIRTPMNAIIGFTDLALRLDLTPKLGDYLKKVKNSSHSLMGVIDDILDFSKLDAGMMTLDPVAFDFDGLFDRLGDLFSQQVAEKPIALVFMPPQNFDRVLFGDVQRLEQVLINLVRNAIKFTGQGTVLVKVETKKVGAGDVDLLFQVQDTGIGIDPKCLAQLFDPFVQADGSTTRKYGGTGLGLTICKRLVQLMSGRIWAESQPDQGSTFFFAVNLAHRPPDPTKQLRLPSHLRGLRVMVVDDNPFSGEVLTAMLRRLELAPTLVSSEKAALSALVTGHAENKPHPLLLLDDNLAREQEATILPEIQTRLLALEPPTPLPLCVLMTPFGNEAIQTRDFMAHAPFILHKPIGLSQLHRAIMETFGEPVAPSAQPSRILVQEIETATKIHGARILVVEDNITNQEVASELLKPLGVAVTIAANGQEAVELVAQQSFDAVLMDVQMPVMDGHEATRRIRSDPRFRKLPIIAMTAHAMSEERKKCLASGMDAHLPKPIRPERLYAQLTQWIGPLTLPSNPGKEDNGPPPLPPIPGLDTDAGLKRVLGNVPLYRRFLVRFRKEQANAVAEITRNLQSGNRQRAAELIHAIKGIAGNVGAETLFQQTGQLEQRLKDGHAQACENALATFAATLNTLLEALKTISEEVEKAPTTKTKAFVPEQVALALHELSQHLENNSIEVEELLKELDAQLQGTAAEKPFRELTRLIKRYDFEQARNKVDTITQTLKITL